MGATSNRRRFLKQSATTLAALGGMTNLPDIQVARAQRQSSKFSPVDAESTARLIESTPRDKVAGVVADRIRQGLKHDDLLAALLRSATRVSSGHNILVHHSVAEISSRVTGADRWLPLFWHIDLIKAKSSDARSVNLADAQLPKPAKAAAVFEEAVRELDQDKAVAAIIAIARSAGPKMAMQRLWSHAAGSRVLGSIGHTAIKVANSWRSMEGVGWQSAEQILHDSARQCSSTKNRPRGDLHLVNARRAAQHAKLHGDWMSHRSDDGAVIELHSMFREGDAADACGAVYQQLRDGKFSAGTIWDAVFLTTNEISARFKWGGLLTNGRARHSITSANAMHFMYRISTDPETRLFTLLQAVAMACTFVAVPRAGGHLNDFKITEIAETECPDTVEDAVDEIFSLLPPRRSQHQFRDRSGQDKALELTYAMAKKHSDQAFLRRARQLLCWKCSIDAHNLKFPVAALENYRNLSPRWRPNYLAASVFVLHGTQMEDNVAVQQASEALASL